MRKFFFLLFLSWFLPSAIHAQANTNKHSVDLTWVASTSTVTGYNVYRGTLSGGPYQKINATVVTGTTFTDTTGTGGVKYFYVATAIDSSGSESMFSNEVSAIFLGPPSPPSGLAATPK